MKQVKQPANLKRVACNLCGSARSKKLYETERDGMRITIARCAKCGLVYQNPRLSDNALLATYSKKKKSYRSKPEGEKEKKFLALADGRVRNIEKFIPKGKLLDIGSAFGPLLAAAKRRGWQAEGVELANHMARFAERKYRVKVYTKPLEALRLPSQSYDVVTMYDLIEHLTDPKATLREARRLLRKGGLLVVQTPAIDSWYALAKRSAWPYFGVQHLYYFSGSTMKQMLEAAGFRLAKVFSGDDIGLATHAKSGAGAKELALQAARRFSLMLTAGSRVYYARKK